MLITTANSIEKMALLTDSNHLTSHGLKRRKWLVQAIAAFTSFFFPWPLKSWFNSLKDSYAYIATLPALPALENPLLVLRDFQSDSDMEIKQRIYCDIAEDRDLIRQVKQKIGFDQKVTVTIENMDIRLLYVPELRKKYSLAYETYCRRVIDHILTKTHNEHIYGHIISPVTPIPKVGKRGVTAFLVHQLGKEYRAKCRFAAEDGTSTRYQIKGACFSSRLGAVEVIIENPARDEFQIRRNNISIWQNRSNNFYSLLQIPVEETFHYILGPCTDLKITEELRQKKINTMVEVEKLANHWLAIEEAIVGGLVYLLLNEYALKYGFTVSNKDVERALLAKEDLLRYRYRRVGIKRVVEMGFKRSFELYTSDPVEFQISLATPPIFTNREKDLYLRKGLSHCLEP